MSHQEEHWLLAEKYHGEKTAGFFADCERLAAGEPLAYVIGYIPFLECTIWLDSRPLIPRPETEYWTEAVSKTIPDTPSTVLDLCAGSGCIGVAIAHARANTTVHFAELDTRHLPTIKKNIIENHIPLERTHVFQSDLFANVSEQYDYILTNPPYIDPALDRTETSVKTFEPHHALYGGAGGLELIEHIIGTVEHFLKPHGQLWLEHEPEQVATITNLAVTHGFYCSTHTDQFGVSRFSVLTVAQ